MKIGRLLKTLRMQKGVSIKKLGPELGLDYTYISKVENSKASPSPAVIEKMSHYFDYDSDELMIAAGKIPKDIQKILRNNPEEAIKYLRKKFGGSK